MKPILKPWSNPSLTPYYFPLKTLFRLEMGLVFMKMCRNFLQKLLSCFEDILELSKYHRGQQKTNCLCIRLSLSLIHSPAPTNFTFSVRLRVFKALLWDARDSSPKRNVEAVWPFSPVTRILKWRAWIGKQPTSSNAKIPNFSQH